MAQRKVIVAAILVAVFALAFWLGAQYGSSRISGDNNQIIATFSCNDGKSIWAAFGENDVALSLSDGRNMELPHATSGSGARYAEPDESIVFWNKGDSATFAEDGEITFDGCNLSR